MYQTLQITPGVTLRCIRDSRFKQGALSIQFLRRMDPAEAAYNALLPAVLLRGCRQYPDIRRITQRLDDLYGASVGTLVRRIGDYQTTGFYCGFMEDRFALEGDEILSPMIHFLGQLLLEPIVEEVDENNVITRNRYGVQVLNSTTLCFVDVDKFPLSLGDTLRGLFGRKLTPEEKLMQTLRGLCEADSSLGARVYRTHNGWRIMLAGDGLAPDSARMHELSRALHADPLYESLCTRQQCWRARLSPKPYRVGVTRYPRPVSSESVLAPEAQDWLRRYETACAGKAVCRFVDGIGTRISGPVVELHDQLTCALAIDKPLV